MTNNQLLDAILSCYLFNEKLQHTHPTASKKMNFSLISKSQLPEIEDWRIEFLRKQLFNDGFLENSKYGDPEPYTLTPTGLKAAQNNSYRRNEEDSQVDKEIKLQTLLSLKRSKTAVTISIFAIVIPTLISLAALWLSIKQSPTEELNKLQQRIDKLESSKIEAKTTSNALGTTSFDTLKKATNHK